jgi:hypothetical protein
METRQRRIDRQSMNGHRQVVYQTLREVVTLIEGRFGVHPVVYGSLGVELALDKDYDAQDVDLLLNDEIVSGDQLPLLLRKAGYKRVAKPYLAFKKNGVEVEIAKQSYWKKEAGFQDENPLQVNRDATSYAVLDVKNLWRLYKYLTKYSLRSDTKRNRDQVKLLDLEKKIRKENVITK